MVSRRLSRRLSRLPVSASSGPHRTPSGSGNHLRMYVHVHTRRGRVPGPHSGLCTNAARTCTQPRTQGREWKRRQPWASSSPGSFLAKGLLRLLYLGTVYGVYPGHTYNTSSSLPVSLPRAQGEGPDGLPHRRRPPAPTRLSGCTHKRPFPATPSSPFMPRVTMNIPFARSPVYPGSQLSISLSGLSHCSSPQVEVVFGALNSPFRHLLVPVGIESIKPEASVLFTHHPLPFSSPPASAGIDRQYRAMTSQCWTSPPLPHRSSLGRPRPAIPGQETVVASQVRNKKARPSFRFPMFRAWMAAAPCQPCNTTKPRRGCCLAPSATMACPDASWFGPRTGAQRALRVCQLIVTVLVHSELDRERGPRIAGDRVGDGRSGTTRPWHMVFHGMYPVSSDS